MRQRLEEADIESLDLTPREKLALSYAQQLTLTPAEMNALLIEELRSSGFEMVRSWRSIKSSPISTMPTGPFLDSARRLMEILLVSHRATLRTRMTGGMTDSQGCLKSQKQQHYLKTRAPKQFHHAKYQPQPAAKGVHDLRVTPGYQTDITRFASNFVYIPVPHHR
ncbi:MAG: hypothetical protein CM1200mP18_00640 [Gammaproteobacteria bacterium]|nr:MAG: hypothetical protein CM1200mP18_00640 [Gammaproteobacteria bacterium]